MALHEEVIRRRSTGFSKFDDREVGHMMQACVLRDSKGVLCVLGEGEGERQDLCVIGLIQWAITTAAMETPSMTRRYGTLALEDTPNVASILAAAFGPVQGEGGPFQALAAGMDGDDDMAVGEEGNIECAPSAGLARAPVCTVRLSWAFDGELIGEHCVRESLTGSTE